MGDAQVAHDQASTAMQYSSIGYDAVGVSGGANASNDMNMYAGNSDGSDAHADSSQLASYSSNFVEANTSNADPNSNVDQTSFNPLYAADSAGMATIIGAVVSHDPSVVDPKQTVAYDSAAKNTSLGETPTEGMMPHSTENGHGHLDGGVMEQQYEEAPAISSEEDRLWTIVKANSLDFNAWTALIQETEKVAEDNVLKIRRVYDAFLAEFPLCYGYWKKYADHEARLGSVDKIIEVYERAVLAVTYSVDIWLHYCTFSMSAYEDPDTIRRLFERGLAYVGTDYLSYPLWDKYIEYEYSRQEWMNLAMIYTRILEHPIQQLDRYFNSFKELAGSRPLAEIRSPEEAAMVASSSEPNNKDTGTAGHLDGTDETLKSETAILTETEELEKYINIREEMYKRAKEYDSKIHEYEANIRRPYFHVRPLEDHQLSNWHHYLDFIERGDDFNKVVKLYERCLIACANYPEFWIRYVLCMEASGSMELAINALARATQVFVKRQPEIHLFAARFKELNGDIPGARAEFQLIHSEIAPGLLEAVFKHANMEYRLGYPEAAFSVYEDAIATEQGNEQSQVLPMLFVQYSRFLFLVAGNIEKAREVLSGAVERIPLSKPLLEGVIHLESIQSAPKRIGHLDALVEKFITPNHENLDIASVMDKEDVSSIYLEFLDLFGDSQAIKKAENLHARLFSQHKSTSGSRKRSAHDMLESDKTKLAKAYGGALTPASQSVMGAYPNVQQPWAASYGPQAQAWQQAPQAQAQAQQWNPGYAQQAGYSGYGAYGGFAQPQPSVSSQQQAAYGSYTQAYPSQNYVQPAAAIGAGQQGVVPAASQAYYGSYY